MTKHLERDLVKLEESLLALAGRVEEAVRLSISSLLDGRMNVAESVIDGDAAIDRAEVELEEDCLKILALHQPVAMDLRCVAACLKVNSDLERIGDLAANIASRAVRFMGAGSLEVPDGFHAMMEEVTAMLKKSIQAFVKGEASLAIEVCAQDDRVDDLHHSMIASLVDRMTREPESVTQLVHLLAISKSLERIADHATNIAEDVVYMVEGEIIRHGQGQVV